MVGQGGVDKREAVVCVCRPVKNGFRQIVRESHGLNGTQVAQYQQGQYGSNLG